MKRIMLAVLACTGVQAMDIPVIESLKEFDYEEELYMLRSDYACNRMSPKEYSHKYHVIYVKTLLRTADRLVRINVQKKEIFGDHIPKIDFIEATQEAEKILEPIFTQLKKKS